MSIRFASYYAAHHITCAYRAGCEKNLVRSWAIEVARQTGVSIRRAKKMILAYL